MKDTRQSSGRSGPGAVVAPSPRGSRAVLLTAQGWGTSLFAEPSISCYPGKPGASLAETHVDNHGKDQATGQLGFSRAEGLPQH